MPLLLIGKKMYAALKHEPKSKKDGGGFDTSELIRGIAAVRRDNCLFSARAQSTVLKKLLWDKNAEAAFLTAARWVALVRESAPRVYDVLQEKYDDADTLLPIAFFLQPGNVTKPLADYTDDKVTPAVAVARRILERNPTAPMGVGARVEYLIRKALAFEDDERKYARAVDKTDALTMKPPLDTTHYVDQVVSKCVQLLGPVFAEEERAAARKQTLTGEVSVVRDEKRKSDRDAKPGQVLAERRVRARADNMCEDFIKRRPRSDPPPSSAFHLTATSTSDYERVELYGTDTHAWVQGKLDTTCAVPWLPTVWTADDGRDITGRASPSGVSWEEACALFRRALAARGTWSLSGDGAGDNMRVAAASGVRKRPPPTPAGKKVTKKPKTEIKKQLAAEELPRAPDLVETPAFTGRSGMFHVVKVFAEKRRAYAYCVADDVVLKRLQGWKIVRWSVGGKHTTAARRGGSLPEALKCVQALCS